MARVSNWVIAGLNLVTFAMACLAIFLSFFLHSYSEHSPCAMWIKVPLLVIGGGLMVVSIMGIAGACCRVSFFMWMYLTLLFLIMISMVIFTLFMLFASNKGIVMVFTDNPNHLKLDDYSSWVQKEITKSGNWNKIKSCLAESWLCRDYEVPGNEEKKYESIQSSCCHPPSSCGFKPQNSTFWIAPEQGPVMNGEDCNAWSNDQTQLCFDCETCKGSFVQSVYKDWKWLAIINALFILTINIIYMIGCCAHSNNQNHRYYKYRGGYYA